MQEAARPRPDCIQGYTTFIVQARAEGKDLTEVIDGYFSYFEESSQSMAKHWSDLEKNVIRVLHYLGPEGRKHLAYHWDHFPAKTSAITYQMVDCKELLSGASPVAESDGFELFKKIYQGSQGSEMAEEKKANWVLRKIGVFIAKIKNDKRLGIFGSIRFQIGMFFGLLTRPFAQEKGNRK